MQIRHDPTDKPTKINWIEIFFVNDPDIKYPNPGHSHSMGIKIVLEDEEWESMYKITGCHQLKYFYERLPVSETRIWTIDWDADNFRMTVFCNGQKVIDVTLSDDTCGRRNYGLHWRERYSRPVKYIAFAEYDVESDYFRLGDSKYYANFNNFT